MAFGKQYSHSQYDSHGRSDIKRDPVNTDTVEKTAAALRLQQEAAETLILQEAQVVADTRAAEDARIAQEAEYVAAAAAASCPVLSKEKIREVLKDIWNTDKHYKLNKMAEAIQEAISNGANINTLIDNWLKYTPKVSGYGTIVKKLWPDTLEEEGCLDIDNPTGNGDWCLYEPAKSEKYDISTVTDVLLQNSLVSTNSTTGRVNSLDDAQQNYCAALTVLTDAGATPDQAKACISFVVARYCNTTDTDNAGSQAELCVPDFLDPFSTYSC